MSDLDTIWQILAHPICKAADVLGRNPPLSSEPGYYTIFIDNPRSLPKPYRDLLIEKQTNLIYIGIAKVSLLKRLFEQDLRHQKPSTFFRGIGSILPYRPISGSMAGRKKPDNYTFSKSDTAKIVRWIDNHLLVSWVKDNPALKGIEKALIQQHCPIINTTHNRHAVKELAALREECRKIAGTKGSE